MGILQEHFRDRFNMADSSYHLENIIATGGQAWVFGGYDTVNDREVAVKVFPDVDDDSHLESFESEIARLGILNGSENIITVFAQGGFKDHGRRSPYIVMERADGNLTDVMRTGAVTVSQAVSYLDGAMNGMALAHDKQILHRDLKPANLLLKDGVVKVSDFGISIDSSNDTHTKTYDGKGTWPYMPVEQFEGKPRKQSDVYAMGVIAYEMFTGRRPRLLAVGATQEAFPWYNAHKQAKIPSFYQAGRGTPDKVTEAVEASVRGALSVDYRKRPADMGEFRESFMQAAARGMAEQQKDRTYIPMAPSGREKPSTKLQLTFETPPPVVVRKASLSDKPPKPTGKPASPAQKPAVEQPDRSKGDSEVSRRTLLKWGATAFGLGSLGATVVINQEELRNVYDKITGPSEEERIVHRAKMLRSIYTTINESRMQFHLAKEMAPVYPELAKELSGSITNVNWNGSTWGALTPYYPLETMQMVRYYLSKNEYNAATNAAMGVASYLNANPTHQEEGAAVLSELQTSLRLPQVGRELQASLIDMCRQQGAELAPGTAYTSTDLGQRLTEYGSDPNISYQYAFFALTTNINGNQAEALKRAAIGLLERAADAQNNDALYNAYLAANQMAPHLPEAAIELAERFYKDFPDVWSFALALAIAVAPYAPDEVRRFIAKDAQLLDGSGVALAEYNAAYVQDLASKYADGQAIKAWLIAAANPGNKEFTKNALQTVTDKGELPSNKNGATQYNTWYSYLMGRALVANSLYAKLQV